MEYQKKEYEAIKTSLSIICNNFNIFIPDDEIGYLIDILF